MSIWKPILLPAVHNGERLDHPDRWAAAKAAGAQLYIEQHFNSFHDPGPNYALARYRPASKVGHPDSPMIADAYVRAVGSAMRGAALPTNGGPRIEGTGPGTGNLPPDIPGFLAEPCFISNPAVAEWLVRGPGLNTLALILVKIIVETLPQGGVVALSIGHLGTLAKPDDRGAPVNIPEEWGEMWEGGLALAVLGRVMMQLGQPPEMVRLQSIRFIG